jgi:hypothetical protein
MTLSDYFEKDDQEILVTTLLFILLLIFNNVLNEYYTICFKYIFIIIFLKNRAE